MSCDGCYAALMWQSETCGLACLACAIATVLMRLRLSVAAHPRDLVVIDRLVDHKRAEVGIWCNGSFSFCGDHVRYDELTFTGDFYTPPQATFAIAK